jgi:hypothetical protein
MAGPLGEGPGCFLREGCFSRVFFGEYEVGGEAERLAQILLVQAAVGPPVKVPVESPHNEARTTGCRHEFDIRRRQAAPRREPHAEVLVRGEAGISQDLRDCAEMTLVSGHRRASARSHIYKAQIGDGSPF